MTDIIDELERLHAAANGGRWEQYCLHFVARPDTSGFSVYDTNGRGCEDAALIVASHNHLPALLAYVRALEAVAEASTDYLESGPMGDTLLRHKYHLLLAARERLGVK